MSSLVLLGTAALLLCLLHTAVTAFHDVPNAVAIPVRHRALRPRTALLVAAALNALGVVMAAALAGTAGPADEALAHLLVGDPAATLAVLCTGLVTAIGWNLLTWWQGLPSSSTVALSAGIIGAATSSTWVGLTPAPWSGHLPLVGLLIPMILGPAVVCALAWALVIPAVRLLADQEAHHVSVWARVAMVMGSTATNLGHGLFHGTRMLALTLAALALLPGLPADSPGMLVGVAVGLAVGAAAGSLAGAWRIAHTMASRMVRPDPLRAAIAQILAGTSIFLSGLSPLVQLSTSQTTTAAILGAGTNQRFRSTNHRVVTRVLICWALTLPVCAVASGTLLLAVSPLLVD